MNESVSLIVSKIEELILATGGKIEAYYPYVLKQQILHGIISTVCLIGFIIWVIFTIKRAKKVNWEENSFETWMIIPLLIIGGLGLFASILAFFDNGFFKLLNPHYYAVKTIIEIGSKLIK